MGDVKLIDVYFVCFCRIVIGEGIVSCCNVKCFIMKFYLLCLCIVSIFKIWYCFNCRILFEFKRINKFIRIGKKQVVFLDVFILDFICVCKKKLIEIDKFVECYNEGCNNGRFFYLVCINFKRMLNIGKIIWVCLVCKIVKQKSFSIVDEVKFVKEVKSKIFIEKYK